MRVYFGSGTNPKWNSHHDLLSKKLSGKCRHLVVAVAGLSTVRHWQNDEVPIRAAPPLLKRCYSAVTDHELGTQSAW